MYLWWKKERSEYGRFDVKIEENDNIVFLRYFIKNGVIVSGLMGNDSKRRIGLSDMAIWSFN